MKNVDIVEVYKALSDAKLSKMEDADKFIVIKAVRAMRPIATEFESFSKEVGEKMRDDRFEEMQKKAQEWQEKGESVAFTTKERLEINAYFQNYQKQIEKCIKEESEVEHSLDFTLLSEEAFLKLLASNDFKAGLADKLASALVK